MREHMYNLILIAITPKGAYGGRRREGGGGLRKT
jgi:hypothetical protein